MAGVWCESFQVYPSIANMLQNIYFAEIDEGFELTTANPSSGIQGLRGTGGGNFRAIYGENKTTAGLAYRFSLPNLPSTETGNAFVLAAFLDAAANQQVMFILGTDGSVVAYGGGLWASPYGRNANATLLDRSVPCTIVAAFNHIEFRVTPGAGSAGAFEVRMNGVTVLNFAGDTIGHNEIAQFGIGLNPITPATYDFGDMHTWDTLEGQGPQDFVGNAAVLCRTLVQDSTPAEWALSSGSTGYTLLSDNLDSTYIEADTTGLTSAYLAGNFPTDVEGIIYLQANFRAIKTNAGDCDITPGFSHDGNTAPGSVAVISTGEAWYTSIQATDPATSGVPFTVDGAEATAVELTRTL